MAQTQVTRVIVKNLSKYGFFAEGVEKGISFSKFLSEEDRAKVVPGAVFDADIYTGPQGGLSLNKILSNVETAAQPTVAEKKTFKPKYEKKSEATSAGLTKEEWGEKDRRITRCGNIQVAVQVMADFEKAKELADKMFEYVFQGK